MKTTMKNAMLLLVTFAVSSLTAQTQSIDVETSSIKWVGTKVVSGSHDGTLNFSSGSLTYENDVLSAGEFVVDMNSMVCTDLEGNSKKKIEKHLKSDDFFGVASHPEATLTISEISADADGNYSAVGDFTIKGITQSIPFTLETTDDALVAEVTIDRSKHNIRYGSGSFFDNLGNKAISDDFNLTVTLKL
ncbi:MAG: YceI family protein [Flavobacteriaceae bacterium]|nr:YceI family protein [Flavobacteriaceae bacterium]